MNWACPRGATGRGGRVSSITVSHGRRGQSGRRCRCALVLSDGTAASRVFAGDRVSRSGIPTEICTKVSTLLYGSGRQAPRNGRPYCWGRVCPGSFSINRRIGETGSYATITSRGRCHSRGSRVHVLKHEGGTTRP